MLPYFYLFDRLISVYALLSLIGVLTAGSFAYQYAKRNALDPLDMTVLLLVAAFAGWAGSHLTYALVNFRELRIFVLNLGKISSFSQFIDYIQYLFGGAVYYGGLITGMLAGLLLARKKKLDTDRYADVAAAAIPLFHGFGRIGCFLGGCCFGVECKIGFIYRNAIIEEANGIRRFPIQLLEAFLNFSLFFILWWLLRKSKYSGILLYLYLCSYAVIRFTLEFWRGDDYRGFLLGLSTSQFIAVITFIFGLVMILIKRHRRLPAT